MTNTTSTPDHVDAFLRTPMRRRELFRWVLGIGMVTPGLTSLLVACGDGEAPTTGTTETTGGDPSTPVGSPATSSGDGKEGGIVHVAVAANPASCDLSKTTWPTWQGVSFLYDRLLVFDDAEELQPALATSWEFSDDGLEFLLNLREGVTFHDGTPFNADAVKFNIQRHIDTPDSAQYTVYEPVDRVKVIDELTVKIVLKRVQVYFPYEGLAAWGAAQVSPTAYQDLGARYSEHPIGTGPFKFQAYEPGSSIEYVRNNAYWNGPPLLDGVKVRVIPEPSVQLIEMEAGTVDYIQAQPKDVAALNDKGTVVQSNITPGAQFVSLNVSREPTSELAVRKAIAHAIDRDTIIDEVLFGQAQKSRGGVNEASPFYSDDVPMIEYDPERAAAYLDEAGWVMGTNGIRQRDGRPLTVSILSTDFSTWALFNQIIQQQLKVVGIDSHISTLEWNAYLDQWRENQGDWHVTYHSQGTIISATAPIQASWAPDSFWTITQIDDATEPALIELREQLQAINDAIQVTVDADKRKELATQAQKLFQEQQLTVWLWHRATISALQPSLKGYRLTHAGRIIELDKAWLE